MAPIHTIDALTRSLPVGPYYFVRVLRFAFYPLHGPQSAFYRRP